MQSGLRSVQTYILKNNLKKAIDLLLSMTVDLPKHKNEIILYSARYQQLESDRRKGLLKLEEIRLEKNRLANDILDFLDQVEENLASPYGSGFGTSSIKDTYQIFISYRRSDSEVIVGRIYDHLIETFGNKVIFRDIDDIPVGVDFREFIKTILKNTKLMLLVIGPNWATVRNKDGTKRLEENNDFVRTEIESALENGIPIFPMLVSGAKMPEGSEIPPSIKDIVYLNAIKIRNDPDFKKDIRKLIENIHETYSFEHR